MNTVFAWDQMTRDEKVAAIKAGRREGLSSAEIAAKIPGATRNKVIGIAHRAKIPAKKGRDKVSEPKRKAQPAPLKGRPTAPRKVSADVDQVAEEAECEFAAPADGVQLMDLRAHHCRFPLWAHRMGSFLRTTEEERVFCGASVQTGSSYCPEHHARMRIQRVDHE